MRSFAYYQPTEVHFGSGCVGELGGLAKACLVLPDYESNPKVATLEDVSAILRRSYDRPGA